MVAAKTTEAKVYACPNGCGARWTSADVKRNEYRCPNCNAPVKHERSRLATGGFAHNYIVDQLIVDRTLAKNKDEVGESKYELVPDHFMTRVRTKVERLKEEFRTDSTDPEYVVTRYNEYGQINCYCPGCGGFAIIVGVGGRCEASHRCRRQLERGKKCHTTTLFVFRSNLPV